MPAENCSKFDREVDFDMHTYCAVRHRIAQSLTSGKLSKVDLDYIADSMKNCTGPTTLSIWAYICSIANMKLVMLLHSHISEHVVKVATSRDPIVEDFMRGHEGWSEHKETCYNAYLVSVGQSV